VTRNILQDVINETAGDVTTTSGRKLVDIGQELKGLYSVEKIAETQSRLGKGSSILGLQTSLGALAGASTGETGGEKIKNALIAAGFTSVANNPKVIASVSKFVESGSKTVSSPQGAKFLEIIIRSAKEDALKGARPPEGSTQR
jgi:hypothetical protein